MSGTNGARNGDEARPERLALSEFLEIESENQSEIIIVNCESGRRRRISRPLYEVMKKFKHPGYFAELVPKHLHDSLSTPFKKLVAAGFVVKIDDAPVHPERQLAPVPNTLFRAPARVPGGPETDVAIIGIPFDGGSVIGPGARGGPADLRLNSWQYQYRVDFETARPGGWFDVDREEWILQGVTIADWGDVHFTHGEEVAAIFKRAEQVCAQIVAQGSFPFLIGGDHSVSYSLVSVIQRSRPITVLWFDAHLDHAILHPGCCHNHRNVMRKILELPNVERVVNIGYRGYASRDIVNGPPVRMEVITPSRLRNAGITSVVDALPRENACYISLDIDVLDPIYAPGTATPVPCGLRLDEVKELLRQIGHGRTVVGMDMVEINPLKDPAGRTALLACELALTGLGSALAGREKNERTGAILHHQE